jgi:TRAP-type C4-dicarboxylate transport system substrate-binding protein
MGLEEIEDIKERRNQPMKRATCLCGVTIVAILFFSVSALAKPVELKAVSFLPKDHALMVPANDLVKRINAELKDQVIINLAGGGEVIPPMQQADAVRSGVVDMIFNVPAYFTAMFPEGWTYFVSKYTPTEERKPGGFYDFMVKRFQKIDMMYLGRWLYSPFYLWVSKPVAHLAELKGLKMRTAAHYDRFMQEMGIVPVTIMPTDVYTALERGNVHGFGWPLLGPREMGWVDKCKYIIDHSFHPASNGVIVMNLKKWNSLPKEIQTKILEITAKFEPDMVTHFRKEDEKEWKELEKLGAKRIYFPPAEAKEYIDIIYRVDWQILTEKVPDLVPELKRVTGF